MNNVGSLVAVPIDDLFAAVEDLLRRIADTDDLNIRRKRARLRAEMIELQETIVSRCAPPQPLAAAKMVGALQGEGRAVSGFGPAWEPALLDLAAIAVVLAAFQANPPVV